MKNFLTPRRTVVALLLTGWGVCADAQSLGTPSAEVLMGRALQMSVPARFTSPDSADECVHADVFYGENRVAANGVRTSVTGPADQRRVLIESDAPIDEPVVTVSVRAGCRNTITRNYTLLPEFPSERGLALADARSAIANAVPITPLRLATATDKPPRRAAGASGASGTSPRRTVVAQATTEARAPAPRSHKARAFRGDAVARGPRLSLDPIDLPPAQALRVSASLAEPDGDATRRATAALLWQAINADPQEILRTGAMLQKLEQDLAQLRQNAAQTHNEIAALRQRLDQAGQPWYVSATLVKLLALLVAVAGAAAGVLWYRTRKLGELGDAWYVPHEAAAEASPDEQVVEELPAEPKPAVPVFAEAQVFVPPRPVAAPVAAVAGAGTESANANTVEFDLPQAQQPKAEAPRRSPDSALRLETLAATFEEVEFLHSLGLTSDATDLLKTYLQDSDKPAPLAYLELMRLSEEAGDSTAVATVRRRYAKIFGVEAPRLPQITADTGVEAVPDLGARLTRSWGGPQALATLEQALFSVPTPAAPMSVRAGRELLSLYDLALSMALEQGGAAGADVDAHPVAPWAHAQDAHEAHAAAVEAADAQGGGQFGLDVDLSDSTADPAEVSTPVAPELQLAPLLQEIQASSRQEVARRQEEEEDAFSAAVASERIPASRY